LILAQRAPILDPVADDRPRIVTSRIVEPVVIDLAQVDALAGVKPISLQSKGAAIPRMEVAHAPNSAMPV
jgi:hypothetical protein